MRACAAVAQACELAFSLSLVELPWAMQEESDMPEDTGQDVVPEAPIGEGLGVNLTS